MIQKRKKVILISLDAMSEADFEIMKDMPNFKKIIQKGAYCKNVQSVYPSLTFPSHASIATGCTPANHGIVSNYFFEPYSDISKWNFYASNLKRKALWDYAAENQKTVLSLSWPVSAGANIRYSLPEMSPAKPKIWNAANFARQIAILYRYGTPSLANRTLLTNPKLAKSWFLGEQPQLDKEMIHVIQKSLVRYKFDIAMAHIYGMDDAKHIYGAESTEAHSYLSLYDSFMGNLMNYVDSRNAFGEDAALVVTGDHSQINVEHAIYGNRCLQKMGLCKYNGARLVSWRALLDSCDGMAYLYVNDNEDKEQIAQQVAKRFKDHPGVLKVMWPKEFVHLGCDPKAVLALEAAPGYGFDNIWAGGQVPDENEVAPNTSKAIHGYLPNIPNYKTLFFAYGNNVANKEIEAMSIMDILPTLSSWMGWQIDDVDGKVIEKLFNN